VDAAAAIAALVGLGLRPGTASNAGSAAPTSPWDTLGRWRLGV
jgi:hypothetical protein